MPGMLRSTAATAVAFVFAFTSCETASAQDKSQYTLFNPTPTDQMRSFNTDRPTKSNVPYTVDAGHIQVEGDLFIYGFDDRTTADTNITSWTVGNPTFKLGLTNSVDFEVNFSAWNSITSQTRSSGASSTASGFGDVYTRAKVNLFGNEGTGPALALIPYMKWPSAPLGVGNRYVEGGLIAPLALSLPLGFSTILMAEADYVKNPYDAGYHVNLPALINLNHQIVEGVTAYAELYADWSTRADIANIFTADFAVAWSPRPNFQIDVGVNVGLNPAAPPYQLYMGVAARF
jgi:hypothetical protein